MIDIEVKIPEVDDPLHLTFASSDTIKCVSQEIARRIDTKFFRLRKRSVHLKHSLTLAEAGIVSGVQLTVAKFTMADPARRAQLRLDQGKAKRSTVIHSLEQEHQQQQHRQRKQQQQRSQQQQ